jgi:hypothetical protein
MFILYAVPVGLLVGFALGGRPSGLARLEFRWAPLIALGMAVQIALFSDPVASRVGAAGPVIYVASTLVVLVAVVRNWRIAGLPVVAVGAASNLAAIVANGGYMPASASALAAQGRLESTGYSNSTYLAQPTLAPLTDVFAMPTWMPFANVFSIGDVLIALGVAVAIAAAMRSARPRAVGETQHAPIAGGASGN